METKSPTQTVTKIQDKPQAIMLRQCTRAKETFPSQNSGDEKPPNTARSQVATKAVISKQTATRIQKKPQESMPRKIERPNDTCPMQIGGNEKHPNTASSQVADKA